MGAVLGTVWLSQSSSRSCYSVAEGTGKLFSSTALPFWAMIASLTHAYALMCFSNPFLRCSSGFIRGMFRLGQKDFNRTGHLQPLQGVVKHLNSPFRLSHGVPPVN
jgi:hypothetical protein